MIGLNRPVLVGQATAETCGDLLLELLKWVQLHGYGCYDGVRARLWRWREETGSVHTVQAFMLLLLLLLLAQRTGRFSVSCTAHRGETRCITIIIIITFHLLERKSCTIILMISDVTSTRSNVIPRVTLRGQYLIFLIVKFGNFSSAVVMVTAYCVFYTMLNNRNNSNNNK